MSRFSQLQLFTLVLKIGDEDDDADDVDSDDDDSDDDDADDFLQKKPWRVQRACSRRCGSCVPVGFDERLAPS